MDDEVEAENICIEETCWLTTRWWGHDGRSCRTPKLQCWLTVGLDSETPEPDH